MINTTYAHVLRTCQEGRYFPQDDWRDRLFVPPSLFLVWIFVRLGWNGNAVSWLSGAMAIAGGILLASQDPFLVVIGSFSYMAFYLLDYVDGGVARFRGQSGISGQYVDWIMHVISAVAIAAGLFCGALLAGGWWIIPFGVLMIVASALTTARTSMGWFAICMLHQQRRARGAIDPPGTGGHAGPRSTLYRVFRNTATATFHENYAIFLLPVLAVTQMLIPHQFPDFRIVLTILGGVVYFPVMVWEIQLLVSERRIEEGYRRLFFTEDKPNLPEDHFFP